MAYQINKTDGTILTSVADGQIDQSSSDITLIGKNYSGFGESLNENLIRMLENFSNSAAPERPLQGQLWFDTRDLKLKIYNGNQFIPVSSATLAATQPSTLTAGDLWYDQTRGQLFFFDGNALKLLGPDWSLSQGQSGLVVGNVFDNTNTSRVIVYLYCASILLGIFSKDNFTPRSPIPGFSGSIIAGFNASTLSGLKFNVTATRSETLGTDSSYPQGIPASVYVRNDTAASLTGPVSISNNSGLTIGDNSQFKLEVSGNNTAIKLKRIADEEAVVFSPTDRRIQVYPSIAAAYNPENINGTTENPYPNVTIKGNVFVDGTLTWIEAEEETIVEISSIVNNKNIILAVTLDDQYSDIVADGGGLILKGSNDHTLLWTRDTFAWNSTEHINLVSSASVASPEYKINGLTVLTENSLGPSITSAPGISNFGIQDEVVIGRVPLSGSLIPALRLQGPRITALEANASIELRPAAGGNVSLIDSPRITGLRNPVDNQDAATKSYVDSAVSIRPIVFSMDLSDNKDDDYIINNILNNLAPVSENRNGAIARILCTISTNNSQNINVNNQLNVSTSVFNSPSGTGLAVTGVTVNPVSVPGAIITITRVIKTFTILGSQWTFVSNTGLPS